MHQYRTAALWSECETSKKIIYLLNYAAVFNDGMRSVDVKRIVGVDQLEYEQTLIELKDKGKITQEGDYLFAHYIDADLHHKQENELLANTIIQKSTPALKTLSKLPFVQFIGISGSLAANNPVPSKQGIVDIDIFMIVSAHKLWLIGFMLVVLRNLGIRKLQRNPLCFNYIMDESYLQVHNKNFYVATEINNMIPVYGHKAYDCFLDANDWVYDFYPYLTKKKFILD